MRCGLLSVYGRKLSGAVWVSIIACGLATAGVGEGVATQAADSNAEWRGYGNDGKEQRFVPLTQINDGNINRLGLKWSLDLDGEIALEATPLEVNGVLYFSGSFATVYAVDVHTGHLLWKYDPKTTESPSPSMRQYWFVNRGVAYWDAKIYVATKDCHLIALDAHTGKPIWTSNFLVPGSNATSTGAPRIFNG